MGPPNHGVKSLVEVQCGTTEPWGEELGGDPLWDTPSHGVKGLVEVHCGTTEPWGEELGGGPVWDTPNIKIRIFLF